MVVTAHAASAEVLEAGRPVACDVLLVGLLLPEEVMSRLLSVYPSAILCVEPGQEPDAAHALRSGVSGVVVRDGAQAYLPLLVAQVEGASRRSSQQRRDALEPDSRQRSLMELSSDWYWEQDEEFRLVRIQASARTRIGLTPGELLGRRRWELPTLNVSHPQWQAHQATLQAHEVFHDFEMQLIDGHGEVHWISVSGAPLFDAQRRRAVRRQFGRHPPPEIVAQHPDIAFAHPQRRQGDHFKAQPVEQVGAEPALFG